MRAVRFMMRASRLVVPVADVRFDVSLDAGPLGLLQEEVLICLHSPLAAAIVVVDAATKAEIVETRAHAVFRVERRQAPERELPLDVRLLRALGARRDVRE